ncbi:MAG: methionyl-tRNA formyltransferase [Clostridia bacterium]|nr:methionyl-tRNA formyltransferase [Clostridia bacterium]
MKVIYFGTPDFAVKPLERIIESNHQVVAVVTQPDKPVGRKAIVTPCQVKAFALEKGLNVLSYDKVSVQGVNDLKNLNADIMVTCAYGQILSQEVLNITKHGVINVHASLLPKYRGSSPIQWSIINGDKVTGVTVMQTALGVDTGDILLQKQLEIGKTETAGELFERLSVLGAELIVEALNQIERGEITPVKQNDALATHVSMLKKENGRLDFSKSSESLYNLIRGLNPWPVAFTTYEGKTLKVYSASIDSRTGNAGEVISSNGELVVACLVGSLVFNDIQLEGSKKMTAKEFLLGRKIPVGYVLGK